MTRINSTIIVLAISLLVLCAVCFSMRPLVTGTYDEGVVKIFHSLSKTEMGRKLIEHYSEQFKINAKWEVGPYKDIKPDESDKKDFYVAGFMFASLTALFFSLVSLVLFIINSSKKAEQPISRRTIFFTLLLIILNGIIIRLVLASAVYGQWDMQSYEIVADIVVEGGNVYAETGRYNYSPIWFTVLGILKRIQLQLPAVPFHFVVRSFLCGIDLLTLLFLLLIARGQKISIMRTAIFFFLSPIVFLTTGHQGQFEGFAILMLVVGIFAYLKLKNKPILRISLLWIFATMGMIVKHNIFYELIISLNFAVKRHWVKLLLFTISVGVFLVLFLPYMGCESKKDIPSTYHNDEFNGSSEGIIKNVFLYPSENWQQFNSKSFGETNIYGIISLYKYPPVRKLLTYVFIVGMFAFPFFLKGNDIIRQCLLGTLFFLVFTTGICHQYFVLPVALAALRPSKGFLFYSLAGSLCVLGFFHGVYVPILHLLRLNLVWIVAIFWFAAEIYNDRKLHYEHTRHLQLTEVKACPRI